MSSNTLLWVGGAFVAAEATGLTNVTGSGGRESGGGGVGLGSGGIDVSLGQLSQRLSEARREAQDARGTARQAAATADALRQWQQQAGQWQQQAGSAGDTVIEVVTGGSGGSDGRDGRDDRDDSSGGRGPGSGHYARQYDRSGRLDAGSDRNVASVTADPSPGLQAGDAVAAIDRWTAGGGQTVNDVVKGIGSPGSDPRDDTVMGWVHNSGRSAREAIDKATGAKKRQKRRNTAKATKATATGGGTAVNYYAPDRFETDNKKKAQKRRKDKKKGDPIGDAVDTLADAAKFSGPIVPGGLF